jgi:hypothetical protein
MIDLETVKFDDIKDSLTKYIEEKGSAIPDKNFVIVDGLLGLPIVKDGEHAGNLIACCIIGEKSRLVQIISLDEFLSENNDDIIVDTTESEIGAETIETVQTEDAAK